MHDTVFLFIILIVLFKFLDKLSPIFRYSTITPLWLNVQHKTCVFGKPHIFPTLNENMWAYIGQCCCCNLVSMFFRSYLA